MKTSTMMEAKNEEEHRWTVLMDQIVRWKQYNAKLKGQRRKDPTFEGSTIKETPIHTTPNHIISQSPPVKKFSISWPTPSKNSPASLIVLSTNCATSTVRKCSIVDVASRANPATEFPTRLKSLESSAPASSKTASTACSMVTPAEVSAERTSWGAALKTSPKVWLESGRWRRGRS